MTQDEIIRMAREAGMDIDDEASGFGAIITAEPLDLERFAALVAAHEREACAKVCDEIERHKWEILTQGGKLEGLSPRDCAAAIRVRGDNK